jgi:predicted HTH transcriptional regulator
MNRLLKIARTATPGTGIQFRKDKYGSSGIRSFLRDVLAMANAAVDGPRYIIIGVDFESRGRKAVHAVDVEDFSGKPSYQSLANEFIEPPLRIRYKPVTIDGHRIGVFELSDSQDRPYMMRIGFPGEIIHKDLSINSCDLSQLPSAEASKKLNQLIDI